MPDFVSDYPGDRRPPFRHVNLSPADYLKRDKEVLNHLLRNTILRMVVLFEAFLGDVVFQSVYLQPGLLSESQISFFAKELDPASVRGNFRLWFALRVASKIMRNTTQDKLLKRVGSLVKWTASDVDAPRVQKWRRWVQVRNCLAHSAGEISAELVSEWPDRFSTIGKPIMLDSSDANELLIAVLKLAKSLDQRFCERVILDSDARLLVREIYIQSGLEDSSRLSKAVSAAFGMKADRSCVQSAISAQKRKEFKDIDRVVPDVVYEYVMNKFVSKI